MSLLGKKVQCLVNTGCELTLVPKDLVSRFTNIEGRPSIRRVWAANNTPIRIEGEVRLLFELDEKCLWTIALVSENVEEVKLGIDWLEVNNCVWDFKTGQLCINGQPVTTLSRCSYVKCRRVLVQECQEIPPRSQQDVTARLILRSVRDQVKDVIVESQQLRPGLYVGRTLLPPNHRDLKVCVANTTNKPEVIPAGSYLGQAVPVTVMSDIETDSRLSALNFDGPTDSDESLSEIIQSTLEDLPSDITDDQRQQVMELIRDYDSLFSRGILDMGRTTLVEHTIDTGQNRPIRQSFRRHPWAHLDEIDRQVEELQQAGFVEPAASPWASNVVLVKKKDGSFRLCVDYRRLNSVTYKDSYPLPHIDTCLGSMNGSGFRL